MIKTVITFIVVVLQCTSILFAQVKDISRRVEERVKLVDTPLGSLSDAEIGGDHGIAPRVNTRNFQSSLVDSSKNGYGAYYNKTNPLAYALDEGYLAVYRKWITEYDTHGMVGAAQSEDGEDFERSGPLNLNYPGGTYSVPTLPTAGGLPQARYPSAGFVEGSYPTAFWNEYTDISFGGGQYGGVPMNTYNEFIMDDLYFKDPPYHSNTGCMTIPCSPADLWNGNATLIPTENSYKFLGAYAEWTAGSEKTFMLTSNYYVDGYLYMNEPYLLADDLTITDYGDSLWLGAGFVSDPDFHINKDGVGYMARLGWGNNTDVAGNDNLVDKIGDFNHVFYFKMTDDYGATWTESDDIDGGGFKGTGYQVLSDQIQLRLTDSLFNIWTEEENEYYYHYGDTLYFEEDTLEDGEYIPYLMTPGWFPFYTMDMRTDADGGLHLVFPTLRRICKDDLGGCDDNDNDGFADSLYYTWNLGGSGIWHVYSPDPMAGVDNWTASLVFDMAYDYDADWFNSNITNLFNDGDDDHLAQMQYFYPNITFSGESDDVMWFAVAGMSDWEYVGEDSTVVPTNINIWMSKSTDKGLNWMEAVQVTETPGGNSLELNTEGYPNDARLESGVHLANQGTDETVGVFYQIADFRTRTIADVTGYEDYKNWVYVGVYENDWEYVGINPEEEIIPKDFVLSQNFPNPFNPKTQINYEIESADQVTMDLFDIRGVKIKTLVDEYKSVGSYNFTLDASQLSSGVYFYTMKSNGISKTRKLVLMK